VNSDSGLCVHADEDRAEDVERELGDLNTEARLKRLRSELPDLYGA
jgi:hypothetical protein